MLWETAYFHFFINNMIVSSSQASSTAFVCRFHNSLNSETNCDWWKVRWQCLIFLYLKRKKCGPITCTVHLFSIHPIRISWLSSSRKSHITFQQEDSSHQVNKKTLIIKWTVWFPMRAFLVAAVWSHTCFPQILQSSIFPKLSTWAKCQDIGWGGLLHLTSSDPLWSLWDGEELIHVVWRDIDWALRLSSPVLTRLEQYYDSWPNVSWGLICGPHLHLALECDLFPGTVCDSDKVQCIWIV